MGGTVKTVYMYRICTTLSHQNFFTLQIMSDIKSGIQYMFQTHNSMSLAVSGTGHTAMECAIFNTVEPGDSVLTAVNGIWGERASEMAERIGSLKSCHLSNDGITILGKSWLSIMCVNPTGARVNTIVAPPGGFFTNAEIEQVLCLCAVSLVINY